MEPSQAFITGLLVALAVISTLPISECLITSISLYIPFIFALSSKVSHFDRLVFHSLATVITSQPSRFIAVSNESLVLVDGS